MSFSNIHFATFCFVVVILFAVPVFSVSEQQRMIDLVNQYRISKGKSAVNTSYWLTATAMLHTIDRRDNGYPDAYGCSSGHSWSGKSSLFTGPCCYSGANWQCMGLKPGEISKNRYSGIGYENWVQAGSVEAALEAWKASVAHNEVMLNLNGWSGSTWKSMGAGVCGGFYGIWFSETADPDANGDIDTLTCSMLPNGPVPSPVPKTGASKSSTPSASKSAAPSKTSTPSKTAIPSKTASPSKTATPSKTVSPSKTATPSKSFVPSQSTTKSPSPSATPSPTIQPPKVWTGAVTVSNNNWMTITMNQNFVQPVVVCSMYYTQLQNPLAVRIKNVIDNSNKFDMQVVGTLVGSVGVHCVAIESGTYTLAKNGINLEAKRVLSTVTNSKTQWTTGTSITFSNAYTNAVVLGQIMTSNDPNWSVFYARGSASPTSLIPSGATSCVIGKHVGEDPNTIRANEQIGYIVIEAGSGQWGTTKYEAIKGAASIYGIGNAPPYAYGLSGKMTPKYGINSINSMLGSDGGYSVFYGDQTSALSSNRVALAIEEDNVSDGERYHGSGESVGVLLFE